MSSKKTDEPEAIRPTPPAAPGLPGAAEAKAGPAVAAPDPDATAPEPPAIDDRPRSKQVAEYKAAYARLSRLDPKTAALYPDPSRPGLNYDVREVLRTIRARLDGVEGVGPPDAIKS